MKKNGKKLGSDLAKVAAHAIQAHEYDELPMLTEEMLARGVFKRDGKAVGRPLKIDKKISIHLRVDPDVCEAFRKTGRGWQSRMNAVLRQAMEEHRL